MQYIEKSWQEFRAMVISADANELQLREMRTAFFAGASVLYSGVIMRLSGGAVPTPQDLELLANIQQEVSEFGESIDQRILQNAADSINQDAEG